MANIESKDTKFHMALLELIATFYKLNTHELSFDKKEAKENEAKRSILRVLKSVHKYIKEEGVENLL